MIPDGLGVPKDCDLLVFGSGAAGATAALVAAKEGLTVVLCEKTERLGGTTATSGGTCWVPGNHLARSAGIDDTLEQARNYLNMEAGSDDPLGVREAFLSTAGAAFEYLERHSEVRFALPAYYPDYHPDVDGAALKGRAIQPLPLDGRSLRADFALLRDPLPGLTVFGGMMVSRAEMPALIRPFSSFGAFRVASSMLFRYARDRLHYRRGTSLLLGNALIARYLVSLRRLNVSILLGIALEGLVVEDGRVVGARVRRNELHTVIRARRGVVLATGGFTSSAELRRSLIPGIDVPYALSCEGNTGDGIEYACGVGGSLEKDHLSSSFWMPVSVLRNGSVIRSIFPHVIADRARPGVIAVNSAGQRFVNEGNSYHEFVMAMLCSHEHCSSIPAYLICDRRSLRKYGLGLVRPVWQWLPFYLKRGYLIGADTLERLAGSIGVDPLGLARTVSAHNRYAGTGLDEAFGKGSNALNLMYGDPKVTPNPCLGRIEVSPFFAVPVYPAAIGGSIGLRTDKDGRVLSSDNAVILGLYACGNDMASIMRGTYPGAGITLGPAITFGYRVALHAVGYRG